MYQLRKKAIYHKICCLLEPKTEAKYLFALEFLEGLFGKQSGKGNPAPTSSKYASLSKYARLKQIRPPQANTSILRNTALIHCTDIATQNYSDLAFHEIQINERLNRKKLKIQLK